MKRDQLKELGVEESVINKIMDLNCADIEKAKSSSAEMQEENEALKAQLKERDNDLKKLRKNAKDNEELSNSYKELQAKYEKDTADLSTKLSQTRLNSALDGELSKAGVKNAKATITPEYTVEHLPLTANLGSPPRMWGIHTAKGGKPLNLRITPTYVGNTKNSTYFFVLSKDHPHIRGEYPSLRKLTLMKIGSPPHTWGIH